MRQVNLVPGNRVLTFTSSEWTCLIGLYGFIAFLHVLGCGLFLYYSPRYPTIVGLGLVSYLLGLRHAFDADHIAAVDDTVRYFVQQGKEPLGVGFFFSLGHATIVVALTIAISFAAGPIRQVLPEVQGIGGIIGAGVSGIFLWIIGVLNLLVLLDVLSICQETRRGRHSHARLEELLARRGLINRLFGRRAQRLISNSWQMYPLGLLFGLGFDTASEIGLLAMTAGATAGSLPVPAVLSLPILFTAGMSVMDTTDGVLMSKAYGWALFNPMHRMFYNLTTTGITVAVALVIGTVELLHVLGTVLGLSGSFFQFIGRLNFGSVGYCIVGVFLVTWMVAFTVWQLGMQQVPKHENCGGNMLPYREVER